MPGQTLEELKKEVQEEEEIQEAEEVEDVEDVDLENDQDEVEDVETEESEEDQDEELEPEPDGVEPWLQADNMEPVPAQTHLKIKSKLKGRLSDAEQESNVLKTELDQVKKELESLKTGNAGPVPGSSIVRPKRSDFDYDDDDGFNAAYDRYLDEAERERQKRYQMEASQTSSAKKAQADMAKAVEEHYDRASKLSEKHNIDPENFKKADYNFRSSIESISPGNGDSFADKFITILGEGSEKVLYHLGVNEAARGQFLSALASDPSGLKATAYLGQKKAELTKTQSKTTSRAPKPATRHNGDSKGVSATARKLKKQHDAAIKDPNRLQDVLSIRKKARLLKIDVSDW